MRIEPVRNEFEEIYNHFQVLTLKCVIANLFFAGAIREMRWLPATLTGMTFAFSASIANHAAANITKHFISDSSKEQYQKYCDEHPYLHGVYFVSFFAIAILGSTILTQATLPFFGCSAPVLKTLNVAALDLIPFYFQAILAFFSSERPINVSKISGSRNFP